MALRLRNQSKYFLHYLGVYRTNGYQLPIRKFHRVACTTPSPSFNYSPERRDLLKKEATALQISKLVSRNYCTPKSNDDGDEFINPANDITDKPAELDFPVVHSLPATVVVPEHWPHVPIIAVNRNPVFPRFIKLLEVNFAYI